MMMKARQDYKRLNHDDVIETCCHTFEFHWNVDLDSGTKKKLNKEL